MCCTDNVLQRNLEIELKILEKELRSSWVTVLPLMLCSSFVTKKKTKQSNVLHLSSETGSTDLFDVTLLPPFLKAYFLIATFFPSKFLCNTDTREKKKCSNSHIEGTCFLCSSAQRFFPPKCFRVLLGKLRIYLIQSQLCSCTMCFFLLILMSGS